MVTSDLSVQVQIVLQQAVKHEALKKLWVPLTLNVHQKVQMV
jgi:hypothetical protein